MSYKIGQGWVPDNIEQPQTQPSVQPSPTQEYRSYNWNQPIDIFSQTPGVSPTGNVDTGLNSAQQQEMTGALGTAAQVGSSVIQGVYQYNQNEAARAEARSIADQNRNDTLKQQAVNNAQRSKIQELEEKQFQQKQKRDSFNLKLSSFIKSVSDDVNNRQSFINGVDTMMGNMLKDEQMKNMMVQFARGEV